MSLEILNMSKQDLTNSASTNTTLVTYRPNPSAIQELRRYPEPHNGLGYDTGVHILELVPSWACWCRKVYYSTNNRPMLFEKSRESLLSIGSLFLRTATRRNTSDHFIATIALCSISPSRFLLLGVTSR
ncbi:hypothetical protein GALMADRAFT_151571 [Galerina marginata CBS 339.88]|uniref:Uncharacterized protein n=1 Tax=Galerina marginata (strain CBS 339.88) TaxID=685588 RepID=A0A067TJH5_GALM3|nr:hypothetical protein GALMADRAFT_151571 [Galerina marginata CBS 339.88]